MPTWKLDPSRELFTLPEVARFCDVHVRTVHNWCDKGKLAHIRTPGRHVRIHRKHVLELLQAKQSPIPEALRRRKPKVVIVEEDPNVLAAMRRALAARFELFTFQEPADAIAAVASEAPEAVVLEAGTTAADGFQLPARLANPEAGAPIRAVVYSADEKMRKASLAAGASDYVTKGDVAELRDSLERLLGLEER